MTEVKRKCTLDQRLDGFPLRLERKLCHKDSSLHFCQFKNNLHSFAKLSAFPAPLLRRVLETVLKIDSGQEKESLGTQGGER